jgi:hypothetical protein
MLPTSVLTTVVMSIYSHFSPLGSFSQRLDMGFLRAAIGGYRSRNAAYQVHVGLGMYAGMVGSACRKSFRSHGYLPAPYLTAIDLIAKRAAAADWALFKQVANL